MAFISHHTYLSPCTYLFVYLFCLCLLFCISEISVYLFVYLFGPCLLSLSVCLSVSLLAYFSFFCHISLYLFNFGCLCLFLSTHIPICSVLVCCEAFCVSVPIFLSTHLSLLANIPIYCLHIHYLSY